MPERVARSRHQHVEDRFRAPLRPRRELMEAIWNFALHKTDRRRRRQGVPQVSIFRVNIWAQIGQAALIGRYGAHLDYLGESHPITPRTLTRQVACLRALDLVRVVHPVSPDGRGGFRREANVYSITRTGKLWIKKHGRAVRIPLVV